MLDSYILFSFFYGSKSLIIFIIIKKEYKRIPFLNTLYSFIFMSINSKESKKIAVVDSSFWININRVGLVDSLLERFELVFTSKVEEELLINSKLFYTPKDIIIYNRLKEIGLIEIKDPKIISPDLWNILSKDSGEIYTIALAIELNATVLVDNSAAIEYCIQKNILITNSVTFILYDALQSKLTYTQALDKINLLKPYIRERYILIGLNTLDKIKGDING